MTVAIYRSRDWKGIVQSLCLASAVHCVSTPLPSATSPFQARDDYSVYPQHQKEIALYNIKEILNDNCRKSEATYKKGISCEYVECVSWRNASDSELALTGKTRLCTRERPLTTQLSWPAIQSVTSSEACIRLNGDSTCSIPTRTTKQAADLKKAILIYLKEWYLHP